MGYSPAAIKQIYTYVHAHYPDVQNGGIYANKSGYHNSRNGNRALGRPNDYSMGGPGQPPADRRGSSDAASAIDLTPKQASTQHLLSKRLYAVLQTDDPRCWPVREFFGSFDGNGVDGWSRWKGARVSSDLSHEWHIHLSFYREYADDHDAMLGVAEIICGVPLAESKTKHGKKAGSAEAPETSTPVTQPAPTEEDEIMALTKETLKAIGEAVGNADVVPNLGQTDNAANKFLTIKNALLENFRESRDARLQAEKATAEAGKATGEAAAVRKDLAALKEQLDRIEQALPKA